MEFYCTIGSAWSNTWSSYVQTQYWTITSKVIPKKLFLSLHKRLWKTVFFNVLQKNHKKTWRFWSSKMKILPQLEPYRSNLSFIRRPETPSGSVPNRSLKMQNMTKISVLCLFYTYFWIPSWSNRFKTYFIWIFGSYLGGMDHFLVLCPFSWFYVTLFVLDLFCPHFWTFYCFQLWNFAAAIL